MMTVHYTTIERRSDDVEVMQWSSAGDRLSCRIIVIAKDIDDNDLNRRLERIKFAIKERRFFIAKGVCEKRLRPRRNNIK